MLTANPLAIAFAFLVVIPEGDLLFAFAFPHVILEGDNQPDLVKTPNPDFHSQQNDNLNRTHDLQAKNIPRESGIVVFTHPLK